MPHDVPIAAAARPGWSRLVFAVWAIVLLVICLRAALASGAHSVFPIYVAAAEHWRLGDPLYTSAGEPYRYSPLIAALLVPWSLVPDWFGEILWRVIGCHVYLSGLLLFSREVFSSGWMGRRRAIWILLALPLSLGSMNNGQSNVLVLGLILVSIAAVRRQQWNLAAFCLSVACLFKVYPVAIVLLLVVTRPRALAGRMVLALAVGLVLPFFLQTPAYCLEQYRAWLAHLQFNDRHLLTPNLWYRDARLLATLLGWELSYSNYQIMQLVAGGILALGAAAMVRSGCEERRVLSLLLGMGCAWMTVFGSATESSTYVFLAPTAAWLVLLELDTARRLPLRCIAWSAYILLAAIPLLQSLLARWGLWVRGLQPLAGMFILGCLAWLLASQIARSNVGRKLCPEYF